MTLPHAALALSAPPEGPGPILRVGGLPGQWHRLEFSEDLTNWSSLGVLVGDCMPPCELELDAAAAAHRFYRAVLSP
jgi:hypothetical protein